ncbi:hypothetical protein PPERSA_06594 [Pseudocohnilembus persalinus]|uniref:Uncharacterized protein n=1 Tax=Pseudocohnilembus persalinus TaxID=266149 RepID=A0A0V0QSH2_PSEPJ|nr:hypothetical protein PPERSA_06594 [Pseudocohnilembus persalinus]|eukprot:KRX04960.1 hypothetical protein PPERSA_06594 [Pseudocohnilembus persalinus]
MNLSHTQDTSYLQKQQEIRKLPKNKYIDKDKLYMDNLQLRNQVNDLAKENMKQKTRILQLERSNQAIEKQLEDIQIHGKVKSFRGGQQDNQFMVNSLKHQLKIAKQEIEEKKQNLDTLKKKVKTSKFQELDMEKQAYEQECKRLRQMLDESLKQKVQTMIQEEEYEDLQRNYNGKVQQINNLMKDNQELAQLLRESESKYYKILEKMEQIDFKHKRDLMALKKELKDKEKQIERFRKNGQSPYFLVQKQERNFIKENKEKISNKNRQFLLKKQKNEKNNNNQDELAYQQNSEFDNQNQYYQQSEDNKSQSQNNEDQQQNNHNQNQFLNEDFSNINNERNFNNHKNVRFQGNLSQKQRQDKDMQGQDIQKINNEIQNKNQNKQRQMVPSIKYKEVQEIGEKINFKLQAMAINWQNKMEDIFPDIQKETSINQLKQILQEEPFFLEVQNDIINVARYLIEDQNESEVELDYSKKAKNEQIVHKFRDLVGDYKVWNEEEAQLLFQELVNYESLLQTTISMYKENQNSDTVSKEKLLYCFEQADIELTKDQQEFLISSVILDSKNLNQLEYKRLFEIFKKDKELSESQGSNISKTQSEISYEQDDDFDDQVFEDNSKIKKADNNKNEQQYDEYQDDYEEEFENS